MSDRETPKIRFARNVRISVIGLAALIAMLSLVSVVGLSAQEQTRTPLSEEQARVAQFGLLAAAIAFGFGAVGAGIAIAHVGAAAMGTIGEKPEIAGQALIFIALAEGLVVFGFITAIMILGKV